MNRGGYCMEDAHVAKLASGSITRILSKRFCHSCSSQKLLRLGFPSSAGRTRAEEVILKFKFLNLQWSMNANLRVFERA
jgi:hypothetical protein